MKPLYAIQSDLSILINRLETTDDPLEYEMIMSEIDKLSIDRSVKIEGCCAYVKQLRAETEAIAGEIVRLKARMEKTQKQEQSFLDYMKSCLPNQEGFKSALHTVSWRKSEAVEVTDQAAVPIQFLREKLSYEIDKAQAKQDLRCGASIPGLALVVRNNIQVK